MVRSAQMQCLSTPGAPDLREWVVQRYIGNPLLVSGRKFHIRAYVLCVGTLHMILVIIAKCDRSQTITTCKPLSRVQPQSAISHAAGKLRVYVYSEMLALFARDRYDTSLSDLSNLASHLTNTCRQPDAAEGQDVAATGARFGSAPAAAGPASALPNGHSRPADSTAQRPGTGSAGSAGADSYSEADVVRLLSELPEVRCRNHSTACWVT
jgi:Tubulin-tyrosine ligase family